MTDAQHPDLFQEAAVTGVRDTVQIASFVAAAGRALLQHKAERTEQLRRAMQAKMRSELAAARARWAPANDPSWLRKAGLLDVAQAWSAAVPYADPASPRFERSAETAVGKCEGRLRDLHPYAMSRYDRLRAEGMGPVEAMQEAVPLFRRPAESYAQQAPVRQGLEPGDGLGYSWAATIHHPTRADLEAELQRRRGAQIVDKLQSRAARDGLQPLDLDEQHAALESRTNLPDALIPGAVHPAPAATAVRHRPWMHEFPFPIGDVVAAAAPRIQSASVPSQATRPAQPPRRASNDGRHQRK